MSFDDAIARTPQCEARARSPRVRTRASYNRAPPASDRAVRVRRTPSDGWWARYVLDVSVLPGILVPAIAIALWAVLAAPRSARRVPPAARVPFELGVFALAAVALLAAGQADLAITFAVVAAVSAALLPAFDQLDA
jgi:hypothetical protein